MEFEDFFKTPQSRSLMNDIVNVITGYLPLEPPRSLRPGRTRSAAGLDISSRTT
jgi:hypothetical protein